jgi:hypothetical protein
MRQNCTYALYPNIVVERLPLLPSVMDTSRSNLDSEDTLNGVGGFPRSLRSNTETVHNIGHGYISQSCRTSIPKLTERLIPPETELLLNITYKLNSYLAGNTLRFRYGYQPVNID